MSTRSPYNDRNKVEQKGKTRKSAAASKPKREAGAPASSSPSKKAPAKKKTRWGVGPSTATPAVPQSPQMKSLRRLWWILWSSSLGVALVAVFIGNAAKTNPSLQTVYSVFLGLWAASFAGVLYLEFGPIRKARIAAIEEAKQSKGKKAKPTKADAAAPAVSEDAPAADEPKAASGLGALFGRSKPAEGVHEVPLSDNDVAEDAAKQASGSDGDE